MCLGIVVLLGGVWIVSIKSSDGVSEDIDLMLANQEETNGAESGAEELHDEPEEMERDDEEESEEIEGAGEGHQEETYGDLKSRIANLYQAFLLDQAGPPRGFSVGISASSPGFALRPQHLNHQRRNSAANPSIPPRLQNRHSHTRSDDISFASSHVDEPSPQRPVHLSRTASESAAVEADVVLMKRDRDMLSYKHRRKRSLAGDVYVGALDPFAEEPALEAVQPNSSGSHILKRSNSVGSQQSRRREEDHSVQEEDTPTKRQSILAKYLPPWNTPNLKPKD